MLEVLVIDDEPSILESMRMYITEKGMRALLSKDAEEGWEVFLRVRPKIVILDVRLPDLNGIELLKRIKQQSEDTKVIIITAYHEMQTAIEAMKGGAFDYILKPLDIDALDKAFERVLRTISPHQGPQVLLGSETVPDLLVGSSPAMVEVQKTIGLVCTNNATVLIQGETGTGKELVARIIHQNSPQKDGPFVVFDCAGVVENLLESELFGHEKGAFTGAIYTKKGAVERAERGTLFLDEVSELPFGLQGKLLGFLQRKEFMRVGGQETLRSNCRIIAASNKDLRGMVSKGSFREDLYFRLRVVQIDIPPLRERVEDIPELTAHFMKKINQELKLHIWKMEKGSMELLMGYSWPGNVRELENTLVEAMIRARGGLITKETIKALLGQLKDTSNAQKRLSRLELVEKEHIMEILERVSFNRKKAAEILGISLPTLRSKINKYGIKIP